MLVGNVDKNGYDFEGRGDRETIRDGNWSCPQHSSLTRAVTQGSSWQEAGWEKGRLMLALCLPLKKKKKYRGPPKNF